MKRVEKDILMSDLIYKHLRGALKGNEADILETWLQKPENMKFFMKLKNSDRLYEDVAKLKYTDEQAAWWQMEAKMAKVRRRRWMRRFYSIAALVIVALGCGWFLLSESKKEEAKMIVPVMASNNQANVTIWKMADKEIHLNDTLKELVLPQETNLSVAKVNEADSLVEKPVCYEEVITAQQDKLQVVLFDGTRVWLNGGSRLKYPSRFAADCREVELSGEAYFEVTKDTLRPFMVHTASAKVEVLGTSFNVSAQAEKKCVATLVEGRVRMQDAEEHKVVLAPGQQAELDEQGGWKVEEVDVCYFTAWKDGKFAFKDVELGSVMKELAVYYGVKFKFETVDLASLSYTTIIKQYKDVKDVLSILEMVGDFNCVQIENDLFLIKSNR